MRYVLVASFLLSGCIVEGEPTDGYPEVAELFISSPAGNYLCTSTLVGPKTLLTAAHCVDGASDIKAEFSNGLWDSESFFSHPSYDPQGFGINDVALVLLQAPQTLDPIPLLDEVPVVGEDVILVGFGITDGGKIDSGTKRVTQNVVGGLVNNWLVVPPPKPGAGNTCNGDSGGPAFVLRDNHLVHAAVTSFGDRECRDSGYYMRTDLYVDWIVSESNGDVVVSSDGDAPQKEPPVVDPPQEMEGGCNIVSPKPEITYFVLIALVLFRRVTYLA